MSKIKLLLDVVGDLRTLAASIETLANAVSDPDSVPDIPSTPAPAPQAASSEPKLTIVDLRAFVAERSTPENRSKIKAFVMIYSTYNILSFPR